MPSIKPYLHDEDAALCDRQLLEVEFYITCTLHCQDELKKENITQEDKSRLEADIEYWHEQVMGVLEFIGEIVEEERNQNPLFLDFLEKVSAWIMELGWEPHPLFAKKLNWDKPIRKFFAMRKLREMRTEKSRIGN